MTYDIYVNDNDGRECVARNATAEEAAQYLESCVNVELVPCDGCVGIFESALIVTCCITGGAVLILLSYLFLT